MNRRYAKTFLFVVLAVVFKLGEVAVELRAKEVGDALDAALGKRGADAFWWGIWGVCVIAALYFFVREYNPATTATGETPPDAPRFLPIDRDIRRRTLGKVRTIWVEGVLHRSLFNEAVFTLGLSSKPGAVVGGGALALRRAGVADERLPPDTVILDVYRKQNEELLILGEPGAGKTTLLLLLAKALLNEADADEQRPIPVVLNLSTWRERHGEKQSRRGEADVPLFATWLVERLNQEYDIPSKIAWRCIEAGAFILLLDGLDEVAPSRRADCVTAINAYRKRYGVLHAMAICCRARQYDEIPDLRLQGAVMVQPLNRDQVNAFLQRGGPLLTELRQVLQYDPKLYEELFASPLFLYVAAITYAGKPTAALRQPLSPQARRTLLWEAYIDEMFQRKQEPGKPLYAKEKTLAYLGWLGDYLTRHDRQIYRIEEMQPSDAPRAWQTIAVNWIVAFVLIITSIVIFISSEGGILIRAMVVTQLLFLAHSTTYRIIIRKNKANYLSIIFDLLMVSVFIVVFLNMKKFYMIEEPPNIIKIMISAPVIYSFYINIVTLLCENQIRHYILRLLLCVSSAFPQSITHFLDYCAHRILVQRVGGGWKFVHRSLQEHFAERHYQAHPEARPPASGS